MSDLVDVEIEASKSSLFDRRVGIPIHGPYGLFCDSPGHEMCACPVCRDDANGMLEMFGVRGLIDAVADGRVNAIHVSCILGGGGADEDLQSEIATTFSADDVERIAFALGVSDIGTVACFRNSRAVCNCYRCERNQKSKFTKLSAYAASIVDGFVEIGDMARELAFAVPVTKYQTMGDAMRVCTTIAGRVLVQRYGFTACGGCA